MKTDEKQFYLIDFQILPEAIKKTIRVKEMLKDGSRNTVNEAVKAMKMSRSAYYKYKDHVAPAFDKPKERAIIFFIIVQNDYSIINKIIKKISGVNNIILTINRGCPVGKYVPLTVAFKTKDTVKVVAELTEAIRKMKGIKSLESKEEGI
ncbi:ACT domain protein PheB family protein [Veillonellaceae bacterium DNF00626]|jgi:hypothetical protein|nr:ACT domain protein PheB family protein [Veillonellaceae bacterium DNF00626]